MCVVIEGLKRNDMDDVPILAVETEGTDFLSASLKAGQHVEINNIKSVATSFRAKKLSKRHMIGATSMKWSVM